MTGSAATPGHTGAEVPDWLEPLAGALRDPGRVADVVALRPGNGGRPAAVLVLIGLGAAGPEILFIERAGTLRTHAGQIALPGGSADPDDADLADTALREAAEEVGVDRTGVVVLGSLPPAHVAVSGFDVTAVVGWWRAPAPVRVVDEREVAAVQLISVAELADPARRVQVRHPSGYTGPGFAVRELLIWGLTGHLVDGVLALAGWQLPWDRTRMATIPQRYLTDRRGDAEDKPGGHDAH